jgi:hypothetical protein
MFHAAANHDPAHVIDQRDPVRSPHSVPVCSDTHAR